MENKNQNLEKKLEKIAVKFTRWIGSGSSIIFHSIFFILCFSPLLFGISLEKILLFLTTVVSLEAIYLAILIQFTVNRNTEDLQEVGKELDEIQGDVDEIQEDIGEIQKDVDEMQEDVDEIQEDIDEIEEDEEEEIKREKENSETLIKISSAVENILKDLEKLKKIK